MPTATVAPPWTYTLQLPQDPRAPGVARHTLRHVLRAHGMSELAETAELLASELVTNAYQHSSGPYSLRMRDAGRSRVRLGVWDTDPRIPAPFRWSEEAPAELAERGRGLYPSRSTRRAGVRTRCAAGCPGRAGSCSGLNAR